jgi:NitT/TauT family transport system substrate-binding protein
MKRTSGFLAILLALTGVAAHAEPAQLRIAQQFGIAYLPLIVAQQNRLIEKAAQIEWLQLSGAGAMNEALISGSLDRA